MFVRVKDIKGKPYLYLVENKWCKGKVKQIVKKYIGRVFEPEKVKNENFFEFYNITNVNTYIRNKNNEEIIKDIVALELSNHGFTEKSKGKWKDDTVSVDLNSMSVRIKKRDTALKLNQGYFHEDVLKELANFKSGRDKELSGKELAEIFYSAGLTVPQEIFIGLVMGKGFTQVVE